MTALAWADKRTLKTPPWAGFFVSDSQRQMKVGHFHLSCCSEKTKPNKASPTMATKRKPISNFQPNTFPPVVHLMIPKYINNNDQVVNWLGHFFIKSENCAFVRCLLCSHFIIHSKSEIRYEGVKWPGNHPEQKVCGACSTKGAGQMLCFPGQGIQQQWQMKRDLLSPRYTTWFSDLLKVK